MYYRFMKCAYSLAYLSLIWLSWRWFKGGLDWGFASGCVAISGMWLVLTRLQMRHAFKTYFDTLSRLQILIPAAIGLVVSGLAAYATDSTWLRLVAGLEFAWWFYIYWLYRRNRKQYITQGHGPLPKGTWVNPPLQAVQPGDLILTSGRIANTVQESVGHGEVAIRMPDGSMGAFSSYMAKGAVVNDLGWLMERWLDKGEHYVVMRLSTPLTEDQVDGAHQIAQQLMAVNDAWRTGANKRRAWLINRLVLLPRSWREWLIEKTKATGYDWPGLFVGNRAVNKWTCIGACLELYQQLGIKTRPYGTGLLGLGTGLLDPIMPVRFLNDPAFRLLTVDGKRALVS